MSIIQGNAKQGSTRGFYPKIINGSLRFNDDDSAYLSWTPASAGNRKTWTWSGWVKRGALGANKPIMTQNPSGSNTEYFQFLSSDKLELLQYDGAFGYYFTTTQVFRDTSAWYHIVVAMDTTQATSTDRFKLYVNGQQVTAFDNSTYPALNNEEYFNTAAEHRIGSDARNSNYLDGYLANVHFIDGQALTPSDFGETKNGVWVAKDYAGTFGTNGFYLTFEDDTQVEAFNTILYKGSNQPASYTGIGFKPDLLWTKDRDAVGNHQLFDSVRGPSRRLRSSGTFAEDASGITSFDADGFTENNGYVFVNGNNHVAWCWDAGANNAVTGHSSVTWQGDDQDNRHISGFPFTPDLIWAKSRTVPGAHHQIYDSVRGFGLSKCLVPNQTAAEGAEAPSYGGIQSVTKYGFVTKSGSSGGGLEDAHINAYQNATYFPGVTGEYVAWAWDAGDSDPVSNTDGSITSTVKASQANGFSIVSYTGTGPASAANEIQVGHGLSSAPKLVIVKNRDAATDWFVFTTVVDGSNDYLYLNKTDAKGDSGNTAPTSSVFYAGGSLNTSGNKYIAYCFADVTGKQKFGTYTGTGATGNTVTTGFRPGFLMVKRNGFSHWEIHDGSRDPFANPSTKLLNANQANAEDDNANGSFEFTDTGFIVQTTHEERNNSGDTYIYAAFAGSYSDYITDYNTDGSIDSRVKANPTTGFSIVSYTDDGTTSTIGHGLSSAPDMIIKKNRDALTNWFVYHSALGYSQKLKLNATEAATSTTVWGASNPSATTFNNYDNASGQDHIAYCWTETTGYSKFGSYTGNGSTTGPSITCGFKPAMVILKRTDSGGSWTISDNTRDTVNPVTPYLFPHASDAEATDSSNEIDFNSNGFQIKHDTRNNTSGATYIYAAFADTREAAFWLDQSGNDNDWQPVNLDHNDTVADSPTNNFATLNPFNGGYNPTGTLSDGNLRVTTNNAGTETFGTMAIPSSGQYYWEATVEVSNNAYLGIGVLRYSASFTRYRYLNDGQKDVNGTTSAYGDSFAAGDVIGVAVNADAETIEFYKNGTGQGSFSIDLSLGDFFPLFMDGNSGASSTFVVNFGQQPFKYDPPA